MEYLESGVCVFIAKLYKRNAYFFKKEKRFRLLLSDYVPASIELKSLDDIHAIVAKARNTTPYSILSPDIGLGNEGEISEIVPARKIVVLGPHENPAWGSIYVDASPESYNCGLGVSLKLDIKPYNNDWWQKYMANRLAAVKLKDKQADVSRNRKKLFTEFIGL